MPPSRALRAAGPVAKAALEAALGVCVIAATSYTAARLGLGNPFAGLGSEGALPPEALRTLTRIYGLDEPLARGFASFVASLLRGTTGPSLLYGRPALSLVARALPWTLAAVLPGFTAAYLLALAHFVLLGPRGSGPARWLGFIPGYIYAVAVAVSSWALGWPSPLPGTGAGKLLAYSLVVLLASWPRLLHGLLGILEDAEGEILAYERVLMAQGFPRRAVSARAARVVLAPYTAYAATMLGGVLERSAIVEPIISYTGAGYLLYRGAANADPVLAATAFTVIGALSYVIVAAGRVAEPLLDPRVGG